MERESLCDGCGVVKPKAEFASGTVCRTCMERFGGRPLKMCTVCRKRKNTGHFDPLEADTCNECKKRGL
ncbi:MAG: hypothetical protein AMXMBFR84_26340 [Candidatus Hydrogenedentota bacterium]